MNQPDANATCPKCGAPVAAEAPAGLCPKCVLASALNPTQPAASTAPPPRGTPLSQARVARAFPQLEVLELIGTGGMGAVFKARQTKLDRFVALKILLEDLGKDPAFAERFTREARVLARLNHPGIVTLHDFGETDGLFYFLMEYVDGVNLRQAMAAGRFTPAEALRIVPKLCDALQFAHDVGILHRDIKPENILLDDRGGVKIVDFGIAKLAGDRPQDITLTTAGTAMGTPHYMAPEQLDHPSDVDPRADIYSLGVVFYEMLTGEVPLGRFAPPSEKSTVDPRVDPIVFRTLERDREKRYSTATEVKTNVEGLGTRNAVPPPPTSTAKPVPPPPASGRWSRKAVIAGVCAGTSLLFSLPVLAVTVLSVMFFGPGHTAFTGPGAGASLMALGFIGCVAAWVGFGIAATLTGFTAIAEIRRSGHQLHGLGLALFGTLSLPLVLLNLLACGLVFGCITIAAHAFGIRLVLLLSLPVLAFVVAGCNWLLLRAAWRWARHDLHPLAGGGLRNAALLVIGLPLLLLAGLLARNMFMVRHRLRPEANRPDILTSIAAPPATLRTPWLNPEPEISVPFAVPAGCVAVFQLADGAEGGTPFASLGACVVGSDTEPTRGRIAWGRLVAKPAGAAPNWAVSLNCSEGVDSFSAGEDIGEWSFNPEAGSLSLAPDQTTTIAVAHREVGPNGEKSGLLVQATCLRRPASGQGSWAGGSIATPIVLTGTTNWLHGLAQAGGSVPQPWPAPSP